MVGSYDESTLTRFATIQFQDVVNAVWLERNPHPASSGLMTVLVTTDNCVIQDRNAAKHFNGLRLTYS
jgi:hypothetical protein